MTGINRPESIHNWRVIGRGIKINGQKTDGNINNAEDMKGKREWLIYKAKYQVGGWFTCLWID